MRCPLSTGPGEKEVKVTAKQVYQRLDGPQNWEEPTYSRDFLYEIITTVVIDNVSVIWVFRRLSSDKHCWGGVG